MTLTFSNIGAESFEQESRLKAGRKRPRKRVPVSCIQCRTKKIRCERTEGPSCRQCKNRQVSCTYKKDQSSRSGTATPPHHQLPTPVDSPGSCRAYYKSAEDEFLQVLPPSPRGPSFCYPERKARLIGVAHWLAPCDDMVVVKDLLDRSEDFQPTRRRFNELKTFICMYNSILRTTPGDSVANGRLRGHLLDRSTSEAWVSRYCRTYGRIYGLIEPSDLADDLDHLYMEVPGIPSIHQLRISLVIAIAMQDSEPDRLTGRRMAQEVEACVRTSWQFQKPCVGIVQVLLLLMIMKLISASYADDMVDLLAVQGQTSHVVFSMGLHRDPALFPRVSPYYAEVRKRLWGCFLRLSLDCCLRSGTPLAIRLEDCDCPLPTQGNLHKVDLDRSYRSSSFEARKLADTDSAFSIAALKLAKIIAPIHQVLCSPNPSTFVNIQTELRTTFKDLLSTFSPSHQPRSLITDDIGQLQHSILTITMHSFLLILSLNSITNTPPDISQRGQLLEMWNHASSILREFQEICQEASEARFAAFHLLWTGAGRAAFSGCAVVARLRSIDLSVAISAQPEHSVSVFSEPLTKSLSFMLNLWKTKFHHGTVAAKTCLLLAVSLAVGMNLPLDHDKPYTKQMLFKKGIEAAEQLIAEMTTALHQRQGHHFTSETTTPIVENNDSIGETSQGGPDLDGDNPFFHLSTYTPSTYSWPQFNLSPDSDFIQLDEPLGAPFDEELPIDITF